LGNVVDFVAFAVSECMARGSLGAISVVNGDLSLNDGDTRIATLSSEGEAVHVISLRLEASLNHPSERSGFLIGSTYSTRLSSEYGDSPDVISR
jgi:hypothetical protein